MEKSTCKEQRVGQQSRLVSPRRQVEELLVVISIELKWRGGERGILWVLVGPGGEIENTRAPLGAPLGPESAAAAPRWSVGGSDKVSNAAMRWQRWIR